MIEDGQKVGRHSNQIPDGYQETGGQMSSG